MKKILSLAIVALASFLPSGCQKKEQAAVDTRDNSSPWGMGTGAEWSHEYPRFHPMIGEAGARWVRTFPEWQTLQPGPGVWNWKPMDAIRDDLRKNNLHTIGAWLYFSKFASADGGTRKGPIKDMAYWNEYVGETVKRYHEDIKFWQVWNEFNGSFYVGENKAQDYADLAVAAYTAAKAADPTVKVGIGTASTDVGFLDLAIRAGAGGHFDFITVHPYENLDAMAYGDEEGFMGLAQTLREMLRQNGQNPETPLWITEIGAQAPVKAEEKADAEQAELLVKAYLLPLAQGFDRVYWFEVRGPAYGSGTDFGVVREDWTLRPAFAAFRTMTGLLGQDPQYLGWTHSKEGWHGYLFQGAEGPVLAAWTLPGKKAEARFDSDVEVVAIGGAVSRLKAGEVLQMDSCPVYLKKLPEALLREARANRGRRVLFGKDFSRADFVSCRLGATNSDSGLTQIMLRRDHENRSVAAEVAGEPCRKAVGKDKDNNSFYFRADAGYLPYGETKLEVTVLARRVRNTDKPRLALTHESREGYANFKKGGETWEIPAGDGWQEHTWKLDRACFANRWGWHLGLLSLGTPEFYIKEIRVKKAAP